MFNFFKKAKAKVAKMHARIAKWSAIRELLIAEKWRLVAVAEILTERTYNKVMRSLRRKLDRIARLLDMATAAI